MLSKEELNDWFSHPVTKIIIRDLYSKSLENLNKVRTLGTDLNKINNALGFVDGFEAAIKFIEDSKMED